jgi:hypothetical protein
MPAASAWQGGPVTPDLSPSSVVCPDYNPRASDLVLTGAAGSDFHTPTESLDFDSETLVMKTANMVRLDFQRVFRAPRYFACLRSFLQTHVGQGRRFVSAAPFAFPRIGALTQTVRIVINESDNGKTVPTMYDTIAFFTGRIEFEIDATAPYATRKAVTATELRLAQTLVARAPRH